MRVLFLDEAEEEFKNSVGYYERQERGLGVRFRNEVGLALETILRFPLNSRLRELGYRRFNLRVFPHYIAYIIRGDAIWVVAIAHGHRLPRFWSERLFGNGMAPER